MPAFSSFTTFLRRPFGKYLIVGGTVYILEIIIILAAKALGASEVVAVGIGFWTGLVVSFLLQKTITFGDRRMHHRVLSAQVVAVGLLVFFNFGFTLLITHALTGVLPAAGSRTIALALTTLWNYYLYKTRIFEGTPPPVG